MATTGVAVVLVGLTLVAAGACGGHADRGGDGGPLSDGAPAADAAAPADAARPTFTCTQHVTTADFGSAFAAAGSGAVLCLAPGSYGTWTGGAKTAPVVVTVDTAAGGLAPVGNATGGVDGNVQFAGATFTKAAMITLDGITFTDDVQLGGSGTSVHDVTIQNSIFHAHLHIDDTAMVAAAIVIDFNQFPSDQADCINGFEGRIQLTNTSHAATPDGVTIENNNIGGVATVQCDGIQSGGYGPQIVGNWFHDIHFQGAAHTDGIQLYGSHASVIRGNFFYNTADGIVAYDGMAAEDIENNISVNDSAKDMGASPNQLDLLANVGTSTIKHNTVVGGLNSFGGTEGNITLGTKGAACSGLVITDNVATSIGNDSGGGDCTYSSDYDLLQQGGGTGTHEITGAPSYVGGDCGNLDADPPGACAGRWSNFLLIPSSPGHAAADDGTDVGAFGPGPVTPGGP